MTHTLWNSDAHDLKVTLIEHYLAYSIRIVLQRSEIYVMVKLWVSSGRSNPKPG